MVKVMFPLLFDATTEYIAENVSLSCVISVNIIVIYVEQRTSSLL